MRLFDPYQAEYFCNLPTPPRPGLVQSVRRFLDGLGGRQTRLLEGTAPFDAYRASMIYAIERWMLFGVAQYRRALDMFVASAAPWAQVTLYYSSFFAANAILGMFGVWQGHERLVDVEDGVQRQQAFRVARGVRSPNGLQGSHRIFWDFFYEGCNSLAAYVPAEFGVVVQPVNNDRAWQINERNLLNYDTWYASDAALRFKTNFSARRFRASLAGSLLQQLELTEGLLKLGLYYVKTLKLPHYGLDDFNIPGNRSRVFRSLVTSAAPNIVTQSELQALLP